MEHPWPIQVCTIVCIIYDAQRGQGDKGNTLKNTSMKNPNLFCNNFPLNVGKIKEYYVKEERHLYCFRFAQLKTNCTSLYSVHCKCTVYCTVRPANGLRYSNVPADICKLNSSDAHSKMAGMLKQDPTTQYNAFI